MYTRSMMVRVSNCKDRPKIKVLKIKILRIKILKFKTLRLKHCHPPIETNPMTFQQNWRRRRRRRRRLERDWVNDLHYADLRRKKLKGGGKRKSIWGRKRLGKGRG